MKNRNALLIWIVLFLLADASWSAELQTNTTYMSEAPRWVDKTRIDKVSDRVQSYLEWSIRRVTVIWYKDQQSFGRVHGLGPMVLAFSRKTDNTIHLGPKITTQNFDQIFAHELSHVISYQKYKEAIPQWLEEGLANHLSKASAVDYAWLATQGPPPDVHDLAHPFSSTAEQVRYRYMASQALVEMISAKCDFKNLLRLSVGMKMENYLDTYCRLPDLNMAFRKWLAEKKPSLKK